MKKFLIIFLVSILLLNTVACGDKKSTTQYPDKISGEYTLYDYENYGSNIEILRVSEYFGRLVKNDDLTYVKKGKSSLKINPMGSKLTTKKPYFIIPTTSERFNFSYQDFSQIYSVKCSIFNAEDYEVPVSIGMALSADYSSLSAYFETFKLKNGWNEIEYVIWNGAQLKNISGIYLRFNNYACNGQSSPNIYLDEFKLVQKDNLNRFVENQPVVDGELCKIQDFNSLQYFSIAGYGKNYQAEWVSNEDLQRISGDYQGKAIKFTMPIYIFGLLLQPRISRDMFLDSVAEGYSKLSFYVAAEVENDKDIFLISESTTAYQGSTTKLLKLTWRKITIDITDENLYTLYKDEGIRLIGLYMMQTDWYDVGGNRTTMHVYVGDIMLEK